MIRKRALVIGGTGNVGTACAKCLVDAGMSVRVLTRDARRDKSRAHSSAVELVEGDTANVASLARAFEGVSVAFLGCPNTLGQVVAEKNAIDAAVAAGCSYLVKLGTVGLYSSSDGPVEYGRYHAEIEAYLEARAGAMRWTVLRPNGFMQNCIGDVFSGAILAGRLEYPIPPTAEARIVDTRDVGAIAAALLSLQADGIASHHGHKYDVSGPEAVSTSQLAALYTERLDHRVEAHTISAAEWSANNSAIFPQWLADAVSINFETYWGKGQLNYPSAPQVLELCPPRRTISQWVDENVAGARVGLLGRRSPPLTPSVKILGVPFSGNVMPCAMLALDSGAGDMEMINIDKGESRSAYALALSPFGQVPILRGLRGGKEDLSDFSMASSNAILRYIAAKFKPEAYGGEGPGSLEARATIDWALDWSNDFYASFGALWYPVAGVGPQPERADDAYFKAESEKATESLELFVGRFLQGSCKFIGGDVLSIADYKIAIQCWYLGHPAVRSKTGFELPARLRQYVADFESTCPSAALLDSGRGFMDSKL